MSLEVSPSEHRGFDPHHGQHKVDFLMVRLSGKRETVEQYSEQYLYQKKNCFDPQIRSTNDTLCMYVCISLFYNGKSYIKIPVWNPCMFCPTSWEWADVLRRRIGVAQEQLLRRRKPAQRENTVSA